MVTSITKMAYRNILGRSCWAWLRVTLDSLMESVSRKGNLSWNSLDLVAASSVAANLVAAASAAANLVAASNIRYRIRCFLSIVFRDIMEVNR